MIGGKSLHGVYMRLRLRREVFTLDFGKAPGFSNHAVKKVKMLDVSEDKVFVALWSFRQSLEFFCQMLSRSHIVSCRKIPNPLIYCYP